MAPKLSPSGAWLNSFAGGEGAGCIFVVDDEPDLLDLVASLVSKSLPEVRVRLFRDGAAALASTERPMGVIADYKMPGMDGIRLLASLRERNPGLQVVLTTAFADSSLRDLVEDRVPGARFVPKSELLEELPGILEAWSLRAAEGPRRQPRAGT
jgi:CheY-like chemotaxis protein